MRAVVHWAKQRSNPAASIKACDIILERGFGKARQPTDNTVTIKTDVREMTEAELMRIIAGVVAEDAERTIN